MGNGPVFSFARQPDDAIAMRIDGEPVLAPRGISVAALLISLGKARRTHVLGEPRAPYCMMGVCFECLVTVDGVGNCQGCLVEVAEGMVVGLQGNA